MKRPIILFLTTLLISSCKPDDSGSPQYATVTITRGEIIRHVTASGTLGAMISVDIGSQVSGRIIALHVDYNTPVKKGDLLAQIDPTLYEANLRQSEGELASAQADVALKKQNLARKTILTPSGAASQLDLDQATAQLAQSEATVTIKQAIVDSARANVGFCKIYSPVDGIVISRKVDTGQTLIAAMTTPVLFTIAQDISRMNINVSISEADIGQVSIDQPVDFSVDAYPDETFHGTVSQVRKSPITTQNVVTYETIVSLENPGQKLFPGMTADVSIRVAEKQNALKVANAALRYSPPEGAAFTQSIPQDYGRNQRLIYLLEPDAKTLRPTIVKAGITNGNDTEIIEGLTGNETIVTATLIQPKKAEVSLLPKRPPQTPP